MDTGTLIALTIFFLPLLFLICSIIRNKKQRKVYEEKLNETKKTLDKEIGNIQILESEKKSLLNKYSSIIDIELHNQRLLDDAIEEANSIKDNTERVAAKLEADTEQIKNETKELNTQSRLKLQESKTKAIEIEEIARSESDRIIEFANNQAKEIAGDAYEAKQKADSYEKAIKAMRNTIEGYKDDYIIPNHSVLDDLADEYSHKEAGEELKRARKTIREMVKNGHAGACDYAEINRKTYAIHFAVDAFNGKVDSALSKVKHDNYGKVQQEIIDAFALVNHNGQPFRNARITQEYLDLRLTELKWAVATFELRKIEREEQAEIKAQIREEEKAIREMEKARKEAEKEERLIQKALEKARQELSQASDEQKAQYESQLAELEGKLHDAEEKGQRAMSMAQQTKRGHVYVISNIGSFGEEVFKIGMTRRLEPMDRVKELGDASVPFSFDVHAMIYSDNAPALEKALHKQFENSSINKINLRKEFFRTSLANIKQTVEGQGMNEVHWTMKAEAAEYRESLAINRKLQEEVAA